MPPTIVATLHTRSTFLKSQGPKAAGHEQNQLESPLAAVLTGWPVCLSVCPRLPV